MLGIYEGFPKNVHRIAHFTTSISKKRLQQALTQVFHKLNNETLSLEDIAHPSIPNCITIFELGIAESNNFNYLDSEEKSRLLKIIRKKPFQIMDFFCVIRYYKMHEGRKTPLKFDYYMLRFIFKRNSAEIQIFHERGPQHVSHGNIARFFADKINAMFSRKIIKFLESS